MTYVSDRRPYYDSLAQQFASEKDDLRGKCPDGQLPEFYAAFEVVIVPSKDMSEGFGPTLLEANASGRPCVASNTGGITEILRDGYNGLLVPPKDPLSLAKGILTMATNHQARLRMGKNGRRVALSYDWKIVAEKTEAVYQGDCQMNPSQHGLFCLKFSKLPIFTRNSQITSWD